VNLKSTFFIVLCLVASGCFKKEINNSYTHPELIRDKEGARENDPTLPSPGESPLPSESQHSSAQRPSVISSNHSSALKAGDINSGPAGSRLFEANHIAKRIALEWVDNFYSKAFRNQDQVHRELYYRGRREFTREYREYGLSGDQYRGHIAGRDGDHVLLGADCSGYTYRVWELALEELFGTDSPVRLKRLVTSQMYDIAYSYSALGTGALGYSEESVAEAFRNFEDRVEAKIELENSSPARRRGELALLDDNYRTHRYIQYSVFPANLRGKYISRATG